MFCNSAHARVYAVVFYILPSITMYHIFTPLSILYFARSSRRSSGTIILAESTVVSCSRTDLWPARKSNRTPPLAQDTELVTQQPPFFPFLIIICIITPHFSLGWTTQNRHISPLPFPQALPHSITSSLSREKATVPCSRMWSLKDEGPIRRSSQILIEFTRYIGPIEDS